jgi:hypothetical protein
MVRKHQVILSVKQGLRETGFVLMAFAVLENLNFGFHGLMGNGRRT